MSRPLISAVMLTADRPHLIGMALNCFLRQTYPNRELIIYDSGVTPVEIPPMPGLIRVVRGPEARIGTLRNRANARTSGQLIAHWDDDDFSVPGRLEDQYELLATHDADIVGYRSIYFREDRGTNSPRYWLYSGDIDIEYAMETTMLYKRSVWETRQFPDIHRSEGYPFALRRKVITKQGHDPIRMIARHHDGSTCKHARFDAMSDSWRPVSRLVSSACEMLLADVHSV